MQPAFERVLSDVRTGPGIMPSCSDQLSNAEIEDVAAYADALPPSSLTVLLGRREQGER